MNQEEVVINLWVPDLWKEYDRIAGLGIGENITPVRYLNVFSLH